MAVSQAVVQGSINAESAKVNVYNPLCGNKEDTKGCTISFAPNLLDLHSFTSHLSLQGYNTDTRRVQEPFPFRDLFYILGPYLYFRVPIFSVLATEFHAKNVNSVSGRDKLRKLTSTHCKEYIVHSKLWFVCAGLSYLSEIYVLIFEGPKKHPVFDTYFVGF